MHVSVQEKEIMKQPGNGHLNMQGRSLRLAQIMWGVLVILLLGVFIAALPPYFSFLQTTCSTPYNCFGVPTAEHVHTLESVGLTEGELKAFETAWPLGTRQRLAYALLLAHISEARGEGLFQTLWCRLLESPS